MEMFKSSVVNTVEESELTFDSIETQITSEDSRLYPSGHSKLAMKASQAKSFKPLACPLSANAWCEHHLSATHNSSDCNTYKRWVSELRKGGFRKLEKRKDKMNIVEGILDPPESANIQMNMYLIPSQQCNVFMLTCRPNLRTVEATP